MKPVGVSGNLARAFITSKLTPLSIVGSLILGVFAVLDTPREEEPQIVVPMIDVMVSYPGASPEEVESRVTIPMERLLWEIPGVEYLYSIVGPGSNLTIVRFYVGEDMEDSLVKLTTKLSANYDIIPPGVSQPLIKAKSIDDVPVLALTLWCENGRYTGYDLRRMALELACEIKKGRDVSECTVAGGQRRRLKVELDPGRLRAYRTTAAEIAEAIERSNVTVPAGYLFTGDKVTDVQAGAFLKDASAVERLPVRAHGGRVVYLGDVPEVKDGPEDPREYVLMGMGPAFDPKGSGKPGRGLFEAVTVAVSKKKGTNASTMVNDVLAKVEALEGVILPGDVKIAVTRNYGETAQEKSDELLLHMFVATASVIVLIAVALGMREAFVVAVAVPVTLALTLLVNHLLGYTLNRVTLFALIFSIGILVDDAIVVVENISRHFRARKADPSTAVLAVDEVGNPTILATFTVIAALMPMAFVSGLMGPYMRPIPVGASFAMIFSLLVAFIVSPYLSFLVLKNARHTEGDRRADDAPRGFYGRTIRSLLASPRKRTAAFGIVLALLAGSCSLLALKLVRVKMLPFDNKSEIQVVIDMPEGTSLERTTAAARALGSYLETVREVSHYQIYAGTSSPYSFNGLVRHYFLRKGTHEADIQVNLAPKDERDRQSHEIAKAMRPRLVEIGRKFGADVKVVEVPPGPPVMSTLVAEVYGPDLSGRIGIARRIREIFSHAEDVVDVDWYVADRQPPRLVYEVDRVKALQSGVTQHAAATTLAAGLSEAVCGLVHLEREREPVEIALRLPERLRGDAASVLSMSLPTPTGGFVSLSELVRPRQDTVPQTIYHKNMSPVTYVTGDVAGRLESPVYAILNMKDEISRIRLPDGSALAQLWSDQPWLDTTYAMKWDGEWQITLEVFRDLGVAFAAVLVIIYILVVAWFKSFVTPLVIMAPIPLTLVGILPGHLIFGAFFTATSMIGFIALSGIVVRNSILLVDFILSEWTGANDLEDAIVSACTVRLRPIVLTAAAVVVGSFVMLFDPIFQGLAIAMMFGAVASTLLTLGAVPLLFFVIFKNRPRPEA
ncbi:MAG TPA: efflux RND transporter permease subunit [Deltaproteobacteria bacterium]|nr:efflux RND transporter permease subunit [Deltaproteobacteria bacterium]